MTQKLLEMKIDGSYYIMNIVTSRRKLVIKDDRRLVNLLKKSLDNNFNFFIAVPELRRRTAFLALEDAIKITKIVIATTKTNF